MTSQSNAVSESFQGQRVAPATISTAEVWCRSVQRELWEYRSIYLAPLAVAALFLLGYLISLIRLPGKMRAATTLDPMRQHELIAQPYEFAALVIMGTTIIVAIFYSLDALHGERRDRSILFWKSLPVSDFTTVLSKASIPLVVLPLITFGITIATQWIMLMLGTAVVLGSGLSVKTLWSQLSLFQTWPMLFFHLLALHGLYYAPIYGWLMMVSAWARRMAFLWAGLPLLAIGVVEKIAFNTEHFANMMGARLGGPEAMSSADPSGGLMLPLTLNSVGSFLSSPGLWIGLAVAATFLAVAVRLRRHQGPI